MAIDIKTASGKFQDLLIRHELDVLGFTEKIQGDILSILRLLEKDLVAEIAKIDVTGVSATSYKRKRLQKLLQETRTIIKQSYTETYGVASEHMYMFAKNESAFVAAGLSHAIGVDLGAVVLAPEMLRVLATGVLIEGAASGEWWSRQAYNTQYRFEKAMQIGVASGESLGDLIKRVRGTKENGYTDGIMNVTRRDARALVRTSVQAVANATREEAYRANDDLIEGLVWVSTLDLRTSEHCIARSGLLYSLDYEPIGHEIPWGMGPGRIHWSCRSTSTPKTKSWEQLSRNGAIRTGGRPTNIQSIFERRLREKGLSQEEISEVMMNARSSMDGQVPKDIIFESWLWSKSEEAQNKLLGKGKAELFREGKISLTDLIDQRGRIRTLEQLEALVRELQITA